MVESKHITKFEQEVYGIEIPDDYVSYAIPCPKCNGAFDKKVEKAKNDMNIPTNYYDKTMDSFKWDIYKNADGIPIDMTMQKNVIEDFIANYNLWENEGMGFYIWSRAKGCGKTFLSSCICNSLIEKYPLLTRFVSCNELIKIDQSKSDDYPDRYKRDPISLLCECKILVLDDIGQNQSGISWVEDILFRIIDSRYQKRLTTIVTSNTPLSELNLDERITSRLNSITNIKIHLPECSIRFKESDKRTNDFLKKRGLI